MSNLKNTETLEDFIRRMTSYSNGSVGPEYWATKELDIKDVASLIRKNRKNLKKDYSDLKTSVKISRYAGGQSVRINVTDKIEKGDRPLLASRLRLILDQYNYDFGDSRFDYSCQRYHSFVVFSDGHTF